jgi:hypothetical protein
LLCVSTEETTHEKVDRRHGPKICIPKERTTSDEDQLHYTREITVSSSDPNALHTNDAIAEKVAISCGTRRRGERENENASSVERRIAEEIAGNKPCKVGEQVDVGVPCDHPVGGRDKDRRNPSLAITKNAGDDEQSLVSRTKENASPIKVLTVHGSPS